MMRPPAAHRPGVRARGREAAPSAPSPSKDSGGNGNGAGTGDSGGGASALLPVVRAVLYEFLPLTWKDIRDMAEAARGARSFCRRASRSAYHLCRRVVSHALGSSAGRQAVVDTVMHALRHRTTWAAALWVAAWRLFVHWGFGPPFCMVSAIALIFLNLGERREGELSAYSVFNRDQYRLPGTFTAEQYEKELLHR